MRNVSMGVRVGKVKKGHKKPNYLLDKFGAAMVFPSRREAKRYLQESGMSDKEIGKMEFVPTPVIWL